MTGLPGTKLVDLTLLLAEELPCYWPTHLVRCVGTDAPSMGPAHDGQPVHVHGLSGGAVFVECLTGLDAVPARGARFCFLPLKVRDGTGAPGRAVAWVPSG